jgi:hypothetical protein
VRWVNCNLIRSEKRREASTAARKELKTILAFLQRDDTLTVTRIDRLARSIGDLQHIVRELRSKGVTLKATEQPINTSSVAGKAFLEMLGVFAEFETNLRRERQMEGIKVAKARGVYKGRPPSKPPMFFKLFSIFPVLRRRPSTLTNAHFDLPVHDVEHRIAFIPLGDDRISGFEFDGSQGSLHQATQLCHIRASEAVRGGRTAHSAVHHNCLTIRVWLSAR